MAWALPALAGTYVVDASIDAHDAAPGDGFCVSSAGGCTLRAAVEEASADAGEDTIQLSYGPYVRTIAASLDLAGDIRIDGPENGAHIDANGLGRGLWIQPGADVHLHQVIVENGADPGTGGSGILNEGKLDVLRVAVIDSRSAFSAAIQNAGRLTGEQLYASGNDGYAIFNTGNLTLRESQLSRNDKVGLLNRGQADLERTQIDHNDGGGILNQLGTLRILTSTLWANAGMGALYNNGDAALRRTTVSGNRGTIAAAAIFADAGPLSLEDVTLAANGDAAAPQAALDGVASADVRVVNSIIAGNASSTGDPDCRVSVTSFGHNLMSCPLDAPDPTVIVGDPRLGPLRSLPVVSAFPAFPVVVHALLPGSPAIDHGTCTGFPDQRNYGRPSGAACDIGAFESTPLCNRGVEMDGTRLALRRRPVPGGTTALKVKGRLLFTDPLAPAVDPAHDGLQVRIEDLGSPGGALVEHTHVTEPLAPAGWQASGPRFRWKIPSPDKSTIVVKDRRAPNGYVDFKATLTRTLDPMIGPIRLTVVLGGPVTGDNAAGDSGACATHVYTCVGVPGGPKLKCT